MQALYLLVGLSVRVNSQWKLMSVDDYKSYSSIKKLQNIFYILLIDKVSYYYNNTKTRLIICETASSNNNNF